MDVPLTIAVLHLMLAYASLISCLAWRWPAIDQGLSRLENVDNLNLDVAFTKDKVERLNFISYVAPCAA